MKNKTRFTIQCILLFAVTLSAQQAAQEPIKLNSQADSLNYSLGVFVGNWMVNNGFGISNLQVFNRGMADLMNNQPRAITDSTIVPLITNHQLSIQNERSRQMEEMLFADLRGKQGVGALPSGVHYIVIKDGEGRRPAAGDTIIFNAVGVFPDGTVFENSLQKEQPIKNIAANLIPGLNEAVQLMPEGATWRIFIPSALGYGPAGVPNLIPPNMALVFEITLLEIKP